MEGSQKGNPYEAVPASGQYQGSAVRTDTAIDPTGKYKLVFQGAFAAVEVGIGEGDGIKSEAGAMVTMSMNVDVQAKLEGGVGSSLLRCCCTGESLFMNHYSVRPGLGARGDVLLAPSVPGEIMMLNLDGFNSWCIQPSGFLACDQAVTIGTKILKPAQGCCGGEGFFVIEAKGPGRLLFNTYGSIARYDLAPGEQRKIDNGYLVAWTAHTKYDITTAAKSLVQSFLTSEGFVCLFTGPGTVYVQTRSIQGLAGALVPFLPLNNSGGGSGFSVDL